MSDLSADLVGRVGRSDFAPAVMDPRRPLGELDLPTPRVGEERSE
jgi:hypothetical protein